MNKRPPRAMRRLARIAEIIEAVDQRCMAVDGPVTPTLKEMTQAELSEIYVLASRAKPATRRAARSRLQREARND